MRRKPFSRGAVRRDREAHPDIFNSLLQVLEEGRLTDAQGRAVDFKNTVIIMTTNLGSRDVQKSLGFAPVDDDIGAYERMKAKVQTELKAHFRPEFLNRIDDTIVFHQLTRKEIVEIVDLMAARLDERLAERDMSIEFTTPAKELLAERGYDPVLGARPLRRTIQREIEDALSEKILFGELPTHSIVVVDVEGEGEDAEFTFTSRSQRRNCLMCLRRSSRRVRLTGVPIDSAVVAWFDAEARTFPGGRVSGIRGPSWSARSCFSRPPSPGSSMSSRSG